ncbi:MAG: hypothetical protein Q4B58_06515 [Bacteroidales bacterium]|nr:hypothetical protein [Bacteroidales bacterium]
MKTKKYLAIGLAVMGLVHIAATFTPVIAGKLEPLAESGQLAFTYMSLMCGALLVLGGMIIFMLADKLKEASFLSKPIRLTEAILVIDGILAACMMPANPCAWVILLLALPLPFIGYKSKK